MRVHVPLWFAENEVDGEAFLLLTKEQIQKLVPAVGPQAKLLKKHAELLVSVKQFSAVIKSLTINKTPISNSKFIINSVEIQRFGMHVLIA